MIQTSVLHKENWTRYERTDGSSICIDCDHKKLYHGCFLGLSTHCKETTCCFYHHTPNKKED